MQEPLRHVAHGLQHHLAATQGLQRRMTLLNVRDGSRRPRKPARLVPNRVRVHFHPAESAVCRQVADFVAAVVFSPLHQRPEAFQVPGPVFGVDEVKKHLPHRGFRGEPGNFLPCGIQKSPAALRVGLKHDFAQIVN